MAWDDDYDDDNFLDENDEQDLIDVGPVREFFSDRLREELDYELYEQEKEEADGDDFPESFEEWKILKEQELWEIEQIEQEGLDEPDLLEFED
jgi:hypothetical protein